MLQCWSVGRVQHEACLSCGFSQAGSPKGLSGCSQSQLIEETGPMFRVLRSEQHLRVFARLQNRTLDWQGIFCCCF